jgi:asparagine synthase (glutamine-hydrolysing)
MAQEMGGGFQVFSIGFEEQRVNELDYAKLVAKRWGLKHEYETVRPDATRILDDLLRHFGEPIAESSAVPMWYLSQLAAKHVKVVLTGDGGDEVFGGYSRYRRMLRQAWIDGLPWNLRQVGRWVGMQLPESSPGKYFLQYAGLKQRARYEIEMRLFPEYLHKRLLRPEIARQLVAEPSDAAMFERLMQDANGGIIEEMMYCDTLDYLPKHVLTKVDRMTMAHGLESRPPLLDHLLVEYAAGLPVESKVSPEGQLKALFRESVRPFVSDEILSRPKAGFTVPMDEWFAGPLASQFREEVLQGGRCLEYLSLPALNSIFEENRTGRRRHGERLWAILQMERWFRSLNQPTHRGVAWEVSTA